MFFDNNNMNIWFHYLIILAILMLIVIWYKKQDLTPYYEGFSQESPYIFKSGDDIYDNFYVEIYDKLMGIDKQCSYEFDKIIDLTSPSKNKSVFLDIGCGTGVLSGKLTEEGYNTYAIDKSDAMVEYTSKKYPNLHVKHGDVKDPILYEKGSFTHILNNGLGIYQFKNKETFFRNSYYWLRQGGYLILHLVDRDKFDTIIPGGKPPLLENPQMYSKTRITDTIIDFIDFTYKGSYDFSKINDNLVTFKETFTDGLTHNVRQNELTLYMEPLNDILQLALDNGFIIRNKANLKECSGDENQFIYILQRGKGTKVPF